MKDIPPDDKLDEIFEAISSEDSLAAHISNAPGVPSAPNLLEQIRQFFGDQNITFGEFRPCFVYHEALDWLEYIEEDCCTVTEYQKGTNIALLRKWDGEKYCGVVGIKIEGFSEVAPPEVVEAYKAYNKKKYESYKRKRKETIDDGMCVECGRFLADQPSSLCPGCEAYQDHTR